jgi:hypothetical protein
VDQCLDTAALPSPDTNARAAKRGEQDLPGMSASSPPFAPVGPAALPPDYCVYRGKDSTTVI